MNSEDMNKTKFLLYFLAPHVFTTQDYIHNHTQCEQNRVFQKILQQTIVKILAGILSIIITPQQVIVGLWWLNIEGKNIWIDDRAKKHSGLSQKNNEKLTTRVDAD